MAALNREGRYAVAADGVLVLAPARAPWTLGNSMAGAGSVTIEITATPETLIDPVTGAGANWETLATDTSSTMHPCAYPVEAIRVTATGTAVTVELSA